MPLKKVIIADDEAAARTILQQYLDEYPEMEIVAQCQDGLEAVAAIDRLEPDLVFLDIQMPASAGFRYCGRSSMCRKLFSLLPMISTR